MQPIVRLNEPFEDVDHEIPGCMALLVRLQHIGDGGLVAKGVPGMHRLVN